MATDRERWLRRWAAALGLLGTLLAVAVPLLPVNYDVADLHWPTQQGTGAVSAPLSGYQPLSLDATVPCPTIRSLAARTHGSGVLFATTPPRSAYGNVAGMSLLLQGGQLVVTDSGQQLAAAKVPAGACTMSVHSDGTRTTVALAGQVLADLRQDARPQVVGIYSDLNASKDDVRGVAVDIRPDTRYQTTASALKIIAMLVAVLCFVGSAIALHRIDVLATGRRLRLAPRGWWRPTSRDLAVLAVLLVWWLIGAATSDDGYILTMARDEAQTGYIGNIYRWFDTPEAPFGWFYEVYARWVQVSTATPWVRLPALLMGISSWLLISREVLPRLGPQVRRSHAAGWAAAGTFLAFWLPYDNGLRPESVVVIWTLLAMCAVERTLATSRLLPAALGLFAAAFALAATPTGLISLAPFLSAAKPLLGLLLRRMRGFGRLAVLAPIAACGTVVLVAVFANQTLRSILDSTKSRTSIGPSLNWYQEMDRYQALFTNSADGSLARRFPVLLIVLCLVTCLVVMLRRGKIPGAALGPSRRLLGTTVLSFALLALTPTKWTHHFGAFAALGGSMAALTALATSASVLRSRRNRALFIGGLLIIASLASTGPNAWWYVSSWGAPWFDKPPSINGHSASSVLDIAAAIALIIAAVEHLRAEIPPEKVPPQPLRTRLRLASAPIALACALFVFIEVGTFAKEIQKQWNSYSLGKDNAAQLVGKSCGLSDYIYVEPHPVADVLAPARSVPGPDNAPLTVGFHTNGLPPGGGSDPGQLTWLPPMPASKTFPVWGNYAPAGQTGTATLRTTWYALPASARSGDAPLVVDVAGVSSGDNSVTAEFGKWTGGRFQVVSSQPITAQSPDNTDPTAWREARVMLSGPATSADDVRLVASTRALGVDRWLAVSAPRVPTLVRMTDFIGTSQVFMEWPVALVDPCLRPFDTRNGISQLPAYRISGGTDVRVVGQQWSAPDAGGPFGWLNVAATERTIPTYMRGDLERDWGTLYAIDPYQPAAPSATALQVSHETHWGLYSPGPDSTPIELPGVPQKSNDRGNVSVGTP